jgi:SAM-dependent methyltransferase
MPWYLLERSTLTQAVRLRRANDRRQSMSMSTELHAPYRLNVGCGRNIMDGWVNIDASPLPGVNLVCDLDRVRQTPIALPDATVELFLLSHVIEHIHDTLGLMQELWRLALPGARAVIRVPHGASDDAWEDPTHLRPYFPSSFVYFAQPAYWRADYGYRGDWQPGKTTLLVDKDRCQGLSEQQILVKLTHERNMVKEMVCELRCVKPLRAALFELQQQPEVEIVIVQ